MPPVGRSARQDGRAAPLASRQPHNARRTRQRLPARNDPRTLPRLRSVRNGGEQPPQLHSSTELAATLKRSTDRSSLDLSNDEHPASMVMRIGAGKQRSSVCVWLLSERDEDDRDDASTAHGERQSRSVASRMPLRSNRPSVHRVVAGPAGASCLVAQLLSIACQVA
jgi:hypothetical protein